jgi:hypothetical protein
MRRVRHIAFQTFPNSNPLGEESMKNEGPDADGETLVSRFMSRLFNYLLQAFVAKDKAIRYRAVNFVTEILANLVEMEYVICFHLS